MSEKKSKPLMFGADFGDHTERELGANEMLRATEDPNWIPGYSEYRIANDLAKAEYGSMSWQQREHQYRQLGIDGPKPLPIELKSVRVSTLDGAINDNVLIDKARYDGDGYQMATVDVLERYGMRVPPLYHVAADGTIRRGDVALMFVDAEGAKRIRERKVAETREREEGGATVGNSTGVPISVERTRDPNFSL